MPTSIFSGEIAIWAIKSSDFTYRNFTGTTAGLQGAIDYLAGGKGKVFIGPGTLSVTTSISVHGSCHIQGSGVGKTNIQRATGSWTASDAALTGNIFISTAYGSNGTMPTSAGLTDIEISDMTIDGNNSAFSGDPATPRHTGIELQYVDGFRIRNVKVQNFLQTGIVIRSCTDGFIGRAHCYNVGQYASASARNGITITNALSISGAGSGPARIEMSEILTHTLNDSHLYLGNCSDISVNGWIMNGGGYGIECETTSSSPSAMKNISVSGVLGTDLQGPFLSQSQASGSNTTWDNIHVSDCHVDFHTSLHDLNAVLIASGSSMVVRNWHMDHCTFNYINSGDAANVPMVWHNGTNVTTQGRDIRITNCEFNGGNASSTKTSSDGIVLGGHLRGITIENTTVRDAAGIGIFLKASNSTAATMENCHIRNCSVYASTGVGIAALSNVASGVLKYVWIAGNYVEDCCEQTGTDGIRLGTTNATATASHFNVGCNTIVKSGSANFVNGVRVEATGGSTSDDWTISGDAFSGSFTSKYSFTGTAHTNFHFMPRNGLGTAIASAATIGIPTDGTVFHVTGTTNITNGITVNAWDNGRTVRLIFDDIVTVTDTGTSKLQGNFTSAAEDVLCLTCDGTNWYEVSRN